MATILEKDTVLCPHCGAELIDDDELCKFCGKAVVAVGSALIRSNLVSAGLRSLKAKIRPMTTEELEEHEVAPANFSDPADPIWDDWHTDQ
ncbi:MAG: zinc ribbon domain-containing protein [Thermodesulfobacteriota bacterium]